MTTTATVPTIAPTTTTVPTTIAPTTVLTTAPTTVPTTTIAPTTTVPTIAPTTVLTTVPTTTPNTPVVRKSPAKDRRLRILVLTSNFYKQQEFQKTLGDGYSINLSFAEPLLKYDDAAIQECVRQAKYSPHYVLREESTLMNTQQELLNVQDFLVKSPNLPQMVISTSTLRIWKTCWTNNELTGFDFKTHVNSIKGYLDLSQRHSQNQPINHERNTVFGWDDIFVHATTQMSIQELMDRGHDKIAPRQVCMSEFITECIFYKHPKNLRHISELQPTRAVEFTPEMSVRHFIENNEYLSNPFMTQLGLAQSREHILREGVFFKAATSIQVGNYFLPPLAGIPLIPKQSPLAETIFMTHDMFHHKIPDLLIDGPCGVGERNVYVFWRMMSEAVTLILADMLYAHTLVLMDPNNRQYVDQRIYPLFEMLDIPDLTLNTDVWPIIKKLLWANVKYALLGDDSEWQKLLKPISAAQDALTKYKNHFEKFFVGDHVWTYTNFQNMSSCWREYERWVNMWGRDHFRKYHLYLLSDMVCEFTTRGADVQNISELIPYIFEYIFEKRIMWDSSVPVSLEEERIRAFVRYMTGQSYLYIQYGRFTNGHTARRILIKLKGDFIHINDEDMITTLSCFSKDVIHLWGLEIISGDQASNYLNIYPLFKPVFIRYADYEHEKITDKIAELYSV